MITAIVDQRKPLLGEKGQYGYVRQPEEKPKRTRKKRGKNEQLEESVQDLAGDDKTATAEAIVPVGEVEGLPITSGPNTEEPPASENPPEEEMDEEGSEWAVKVGNEPPPRWAKRRPSDEAERAGPSKKTKTK